MWWAGCRLLRSHSTKSTRCPLERLLGVYTSTQMYITPET